jgi:hypothetical protein
LFVQEIFKISPKQFHWNAGQGIRDNVAKRLTANFTAMEKFDRERMFPSIPSPRGANWRNYVIHRIKMMEDGLDTYARRRYARLSLDKYIESQRERDMMAKAITKNKPSLIIIGDVDLPANSPIGKKKTKRCPGTRKLENSIKKLHHSDVVRVNEDYTSQNCASCMTKFPIHTKRYRFKTCKNCPRNAPIPAEIAEYMSFPKLIITKKSRRRKKLDRAVKKCINRGIINQATLGPEFQPGRLASPKMYFRKTWPLNPVNAVQVEDDDANNNDQHPDEEQQQQQQQQRPCTIVWHRDIVAARCIMYKGKSAYRNWFGIILIRFY